MCLSVMQGTCLLQKLVCGERSPSRICGSPIYHVPMLDLLCDSVPVWHEDRKGRIRFAENCSGDEAPIRDDDEACGTVPALTVLVAGKPVVSVRGDILRCVFAGCKGLDNSPPEDVLAEGRLPMPCNYHPTIKTPMALRMVSGAMGVFTLMFRWIRRFPGRFPSSG